MESKIPRKRKSNGNGNLFINVVKKLFQKTVRLIWLSWPSIQQISDSIIVAQTLYNMETENSCWWQWM